MKTFVRDILALAVILILASCRGKEPGKEDHAPDHGKETHQASHEGGHEEDDHGEAFKPGVGIILTEETRQSLGLETVRAAEAALPSEVRFPVQVFGEDHIPWAAESEHLNCTLKAVGFVPAAQAALIQRGTPVNFETRSGIRLIGSVLTVNPAVRLSDAEVIVYSTNQGVTLKPSEFLEATIPLPGQGATTVVPASAVLRSTEGSFVYKVNGKAFLRTAVRTGNEMQGSVVIMDGLSVGDEIVAKPVKQLWLIELRATKGGQHSH